MKIQNITPSGKRGKGNVFSITPFSRTIENDNISHVSFNVRDDENNRESVITFSRAEIEMMISEFERPISGIHSGAYL